VLTTDFRKNKGPECGFIFRNRGSGSMTHVSAQSIFSPFNPIIYYREHIIVYECFISNIWVLSCLVLSCLCRVVISVPFCHYSGWSRFSNIDILKISNLLRFRSECVKVPLLDGTLCFARSCNKIYQNRFNVFIFIRYLLVDQGLSKLPWTGSENHSFVFLLLQFYSDSAAVDLQGSEVDSSSPLGTSSTCKYVIMCLWKLGNWLVLSRCVG